MDPDRRRFLAELSALSASLAAVSGLGGCRKTETATPPAAAIFDPPARELLDQLVDHVLPEDDSAGARQAGCADFIAAQMARSEFAMLATVLQRGLQAVAAELRKRQAASFSGLEPGDRDQLLRAVEARRTRKFDGRRFVQLLVVLTLEGFLSHPRHGGNRGGVGWKAVGFEPVRWGPADARAWKGDAR